MDDFGKAWDGPTTCNSAAGLGHPGLRNELKFVFVPFVTGL